MLNIYHTFTTAATLNKHNYSIISYIFVCICLGVKSGPGEQSSKQKYYPDSNVTAQKKPVVQSPCELQSVSQSSKHRNQSTNKPAVDAREVRNAVSGNRRKEC